MKYLFIPHEDNEFESMCTGVAEVLNSAMAQKEMPSKLSKPVLSKWAEFEAALEEERELQTALEQAIAQKNRKRATLEDSLCTLMRSFQKYPRTGYELCSRMNVPKESGIWPASVDGSEAPLIDVTTRGGRVTVHFHDRTGADRPGWAWGAIIYRRKVGRKDWEFVGCSSRSPYVDETEGLSGEYEYRATYRSSKSGNPGPESDYVRVKVSAAKAA